MWMPQHLRSPALDPATGGDPYYAQTVLIAGNESGADGTTTFLDQSSYARTLTAVGNAQWDTGVTPPPDLTSTILFDGSGDRVTAASDASLNVGSGPLTFECTFQPSALGTKARVLVWNGSANAVNNGSVLFYITADARLAAFDFVNNSVICQSAASIVTTGVWYHGALTRTADDWNIWLAGSSVASATRSVTFTSQVANIGGNSTGTDIHFAGSMGSVRMTTACRYTVAFTPPTLPLPTS